MLDVMEAAGRCAFFRWHIQADIYGGIRKGEDIPYPLCPYPVGTEEGQVWRRGFHNAYTRFAEYSSSSGGIHNALSMPLLAVRGMEVTLRKRSSTHT